MGYLDKTTMSVTAHFTKRGREILANALSGATDDSYVITQFALGDDEIDYGLWDETQASNLEGRIIENMPVLESFVNQKEIMNSFIIDPPEIPFGSKISNVLDQIVLESRNEIIDIIPSTENHGETEEYEFFLEHDNLFEMYDPFVSPVTNFTMGIAKGDAPMTDFIMSVAAPPEPPPTADFTEMHHPSGLVPLNVEFTDTSIGDNLTYLWNFGDGQTSNEQNPNNVYTNSGEYTVTLVVTNNIGTNTKTDLITAVQESSGGGDDDEPVL
jgi:hypothetical protein